MSFHQILSYIGSIYHDLTNQVMIVHIGNYYASFCLVQYIFKKE